MIYLYCYIHLSYKIKTKNARSFTNAAIAFPTSIDDNTGLFASVGVEVDIGVLEFVQEIIPVLMQPVVVHVPGRQRTQGRYRRRWMLQVIHEGLLVILDARFFLQLVRSCSQLVPFLLVLELV